jgi:3-isopropylmalate dehydratase small subunit
MVLYGNTHRVDGAITTDAIIAPAQRADDPALLAAHCLARVDPSLAERIQPGDILVAGASFGAGADPEPAIWALQALGVAVIICESAAATFVELAQVYGLPVLACPAAAHSIPSSALVRIDLESGRITERASGAIFQAPPSTAALVAAVRRSELMTRMRQVVEEEGFDG